MDINIAEEMKAQLAFIDYCVEKEDWYMGVQAIKDLRALVEYEKYLEKHKKGDNTIW